MAICRSIHRSIHSVRRSICLGPAVQLAHLGGHLPQGLVVELGLAQLVQMHDGIILQMCFDNMPLPA